MRIAITSNGPGEFSGWVRPLMHALYERDEQTDVTLFFVPDDYATGREGAVARALFPRLRVVEPRQYARFAFRMGRIDGLRRADLVLYLGGDLLHAVRVQRRLGGRAHAYKFSRRRYRSVFDRVYAVDAPNAAQLDRWGVPAERIEIVGNLAVDGALAEASSPLSGSEPPPSVVEGGILIMPGARRREVENLVPFFLAVARWLRRFAPDVPVAFGLSPFTADDDVRAALQRGGDSRFWGARGTVQDAAILGDEPGERFPIVRASMRYARAAAVTIAIPGTKCIELAALGAPTVVCAPLNAPELIVVNGPLTYLDRLPLIGAPLKRSVVLRVARRHRFLAQPNVDAGDLLMPELRGALMPARVARVALDYLGDAAARERAATALRLLYGAHVGAAERMARSMLASG